MIRQVGTGNLSFDFERDARIYNVHATFDVWDDGQIVVDRVEIGRNGCLIEASSLVHDGVHEAAREYLQSLLSDRAQAQEAEGRIEQLAARVAELELENSRLRTPLRPIVDRIHKALGCAEQSDDESLPEMVETWVRERREKIAELERELDRWPALDCPCCGKKAARATFFEDGQETTCGCGGRVYADGNAFIRLDECESKECAEGSTALAPRAEATP